MQHVIIKPHRSSNKIMFKLERKDSYEWFMGRGWPGQWKTFNDPDFNWPSYSSAACVSCRTLHDFNIPRGKTGVWKNRHVSMVRTRESRAQIARGR